MKNDKDWEEAYEKLLNESARKARKLEEKLQLAKENLQLEKILVGMKFTKREAEIIILIANNFSNGEIAQQLGVTHWTVRTYLKNLYKKAKVTRRPNLVSLVHHILLNKDNGAPSMEQ